LARARNTKSKINRLSPEQRADIERMLREDRLTLDEMMAELQGRYPGAEQPSRSGLGRYKRSFDVLAGRLRDIQAASKVLVAELGEDINDRGGQLLVEAITTLATDAALKAQDSEDGITIKEVGELARGARAVLQARTMSLRERQAIEKAVEERVIAKQTEQLEAARKSGDATADSVQFFRRKILGLPE
jgi:hypothetical protein